MKLPKKFVYPGCALGALLTLIVIGTTIQPAAQTSQTVQPTSSIASPTSSSPSPPPGTVVVDVLDGDTLKVGDGRTVRIIGIDAPETIAPGKPVECWGPQATEFARNTLLNQPVALIADPTQDATDAFGRTLSYVLLSDGRDFSILAAEGGYARAYVYKTPSQHHDVIAAAESRARAAGRGLWAPGCASPPVPVPAPQPAVQQPGPVPPPAPAPGGSVYYANCDAAKAAGAAPLYRGQPGYRPGLDRDNDGVACEK